MINTHGNKKVIVDADALIGLIHETDALHARCLKVSRHLATANYATIILLPTVLEAATTLAKDKTIRRPDLAKRLLEDYASVAYEDAEKENVIKILAYLYNTKTSPKNTPFDYYVLSYAKQNKIKYVFSFDRFYKNRGLTLAEELVK